MISEPDSAYFALSAVMVDAESVAIFAVESAIIVVVSAIIAVVSAVVSTVPSSVFGLLWQAANVSMVPTNRSVVTFFIMLCGGLFSYRCKNPIFPA